MSSAPNRRTLSPSSPHRLVSESDVERSFDPWPKRRMPFKSLVTPPSSETVSSDSSTSASSLSSTSKKKKSKKSKKPKKSKKSKSKSKKRKKIRYTSTQQNAYFILKLWIIIIFRLLSYAFKVRSGEIKKSANEKRRADRIFGNYYDRTINYLHKMVDIWRIGPDLENMTRARTEMMSRELKEFVTDIFGVCKRTCKKCVPYFVLTPGQRL